MTPPSGVPIALNPRTWPHGLVDWAFSVDDLTLAELADFPTSDYTFTFNGEADSVTLYHNPTAPTNFANITDPVHNSTNVSLNPTFTWDSCVGYGDALQMGIGEEEADENVDGAFMVDIREISWSVGPLNPGRLHWMEVSVLTGTTPSGQRTEGLDDFNYYDRFESCSGIYFTTVNPVDVHSIWVHTKKSHRAGAPEIDPFDLGSLVFGDNITSVQVTSPADVTEALELGPGYWYWDREEKYATLEDLHQDFPVGFYEFTFNQGETTEDSVVVWIDPEQPTGFANITYPADGATDVPLTPTFTWELCVGYGDSLWAGVDDIEADTDLYMEGLNIGQTSWSPGPLVMGRLCGFTVSVEIASPIQHLTTDKGDPLTCSDVFWWSNEVRFTIPGLVSVDIKPGSYPNSINPKARGVIPVAILTTEDFDASAVDPSTVALEGVLAKEKGKSGKYGSLEDVDADGDLDLVVHIPNTIDWADDATEATLTGETWDGVPIEGTDSVRIVPPEQ